jgi:hypothetical protein
MVVPMVSRAKVYWPWRDLRLLYVLLVWAAVGASRTNCVSWHGDRAATSHGVGAAAAGLK